MLLCHSGAPAITLYVALLTDFCLWHPLNNKIRFQNLCHYLIKIFPCLLYKFGTIGEEDWGEDKVGK